MSSDLLESTYVEGQTCYSASAISTYVDCERKWGWNYLEHVPRVDKPSTALGTMVHKQIEEYYHGIPLDFSHPSGYVAASILEYLPEPREGLEVESEFLLISPKHRYYGLIDLLDYGTIFDHKSTSSLSWAKTEDDLREDIQAILYATQALTRWPELPSVNLQWTYGQTKGARKSKPVCLTLTHDEVAPRFLEIEGICDEIDSHKGKRALDLQPNPDACQKFGGCDFRHLCNLSPLANIRSVMSQGQSSLIAQLKARQAAAAQGAPQAAPTAPEAPKASPVKDGQINPPEYQPPPASAEARDARTDVPEAPKAAPVLEAPKAPTAAPTTLATPEEPKAPKAAKTGIGTLYVNCFPLVTGTQRKKPEDFSTVVAKANAIIAATEFKGQDGKAFQITDYRFMPYGQGPAVLLAAVRQALNEIGRIDELTITTDAAETSAVLSWLLDTADRVVRGL